MRSYIVLFIVLMFGAAVFCSEESNQDESLIRQKRHFGLENDYYGGYPGYGGKILFEIT